MYSVSEAYIEQMMKKATRRRLTGVIGEQAFTGADVVDGSFEVSDRATTESDTKIGGVYMGELALVFVPSFLSKIARDEYRGLEISPFIGLWVPDPEDEVNGGAWVDVPVGVFTVQSPKISKRGIEIAAYDHMMLLDRKFNIDQTSATPWNYLTYMADVCGVELGNTQEEIEALPNGMEVLGVYPENDIETFRDFLYWLAQSMGCFACADREGRIVLRPFGSPTGVNFDEMHRDTDVVFSGYTTKWTGISIVDIETKMTRYYGLEVDDGLTMNLGSNPLLQMGTPEAVSRRRIAVLNAIAQIQFTPFYANSARDPIFDLGDAIPFTGGISGESTGCVMAYTYSLDNYTFEGYGDDPALSSARSKTDKNIAGLMQNTTENEVTYYNFANLEPIVFGSEQEVTIAELHFTSAQQTTVKILHEFIFDMIKDLAVDGSYEVRYYLDEQLINYTPYESLSALKISTDIPEPEEELTEPIEAVIDPVAVSITRDFFYVLKDVDPNIRHSWEVRILAHGIEQVSIAVNHAHVTLEGQRLYGDEYFDGYIEAKEPITVIPVGNLAPVEITDEAVFVFNQAIANIVNDNLELVDVADLGLITIAEGSGVLSPHVYMDGGFFIAAEDDSVLCAEDETRLITE